MTAPVKYPFVCHVNLSHQMLPLLNLFFAFYFNYFQRIHFSFLNVLGNVMESLLEKLWAHMSATALKRTPLTLLSCEQLNTFFFSSSHSNIRSDMFYKIALFKNFGKLARKRLCRSWFLIKLYTIKPANLFKRDFSSDVLL